MREQEEHTPRREEGEMPVRRWAHPIPPPRQREEIHYILSALSYQNQLLADIHALLERLVQREES